MEKKPKQKKKNSNNKWILQIFIMSFFISLGFSFGSEIVLSKVGAIVGSIILISVILFGVLFDMIVTAVTSADIGPFNSMSARKVRGADIAVMFKKNAEKVSSFCNDVIGDICGIVSGSVGAMLAINISIKFNISTILITLFTSSIISSLTVGGKAIGKKYAIKNSDSIIFIVAKILNKFKKIEKNKFSIH